jgi:hypothetical protein
MTPSMESSTERTVPASSRELSHPSTTVKTTGVRSVLRCTRKCCSWRHAGQRRASAFSTRRRSKPPKCIGGLPGGVFDAYWDLTATNSAVLTCCAKPVKVVG